MSGFNNLRDTYLSLIGQYLRLSEIMAFADIFSLRKQGTNCLLDKSQRLRI